MMRMIIRKRCLCIRSSRGNGHRAYITRKLLQLGLTVMYRNKYTIREFDSTLYA